MFTALAAGCLLAPVARHWWTAGVLALFAGATRPSGIVLDSAQRGEGRRERDDRLSGSGCGTVPVPPR